MNSTLDPTQLPLRDIHLPNPVSWWPPAPGWWILAAVALGLVVFAWVRHRRGARHRAALRALDDVASQLQSGADPVTSMQQVSEVLRRFAMTITPDTGEVAGLTGNEWLDFLDDRWEPNAFGEGSGRRLLTGPYSRAGALGREEALELNRLCQAWVKSQPRGR